MEKIVPMREADSEQLCPKCSSPTQRQISLPSQPTFKGDGWTPKHYSMGDIESASADDLREMQQ